MPGLSEQKIEIVRTLVETAPDKVVGGLQKALAEAAGDPGLDAVRRLVETEAKDRRLRNAILQPVAPLCVGDGKSDKLTFPARALALIWRGLKTEASVEVEDAATALAELKPDDPAPECFDGLATFAAAGLRQRDLREFAAAAALCDEARAGGAGLMAACLDLAPLVRAATPRLAEWISRTTEENTAAARLAYKDAVEVADDSGARFFEMLSGQLAHPWMILRIISAVMDGPDEAYFAGSELADFPVRLMDEIDRDMTTVSRFNGEGGAAAALACAKQVEEITLKIAELEECIHLARSGVWGGRLAKQKGALASVVESRLKETEKVALAALPTQTARILKLRKQVPNMAGPPDERTVARAMTLITFADEIRSSASYGGFASTRTKVMEAIGEFIDPYVEEVLDRIKTGDAPDVDIACQYLAVCADFARLARDEKAAEIIRRRMAAACVAEKALHEHPEDEA